MRKVIKTANRFDNLWTGIVMLPALIVMLNAGIALHNGEATPGDFTAAAGQVATKFTDQYTPYVETTGSAIANGASGLIGMVASCAGSSFKTSGPIRLSGTSRSNGCAFKSGDKNTRASRVAVRPFRSY